MLVRTDLVEEVAVELELLPEIVPVGDLLPAEMLVLHRLVEALDDAVRLRARVLRPRMPQLGAVVDEGLKAFDL